MIILNNTNTTGVQLGSESIVRAVIDNDVVWEREYITNGLVHHYDAINNTGSGHNPLATVWKDLVGTNDGALQFGGDWIGGDSLRFNGNNRVMFNGAITSDYTIMTTMSLVKSGTHPRLFGDPRFPTVYFHTNAGTSILYAFAFYSLQAGGVVTYDDTFNTRPTAVVPQANTRMHVAIRSTGSGGPARVELFVNGIKVGETTREVPAVANTANAYLGGNSTTTRFFNGTMSNFMRFDRALSDYEIHNNALVDKLRYNIP